jgi:diguanylate cyclase (GGDEF)-like protein/PAS domain S-box-containing protein
MISKKPSRKNKDISAPDEQIFRHVFDGHSAVMLLVEPQSGNILDANQAAVDFYGYPKLKLCSMAIHEINTLPPEQIADERQKAINEERNYFIFPHRLASGEERIVEVHSSPIALHDKQVLFSIIHDITARKQAEDNLRRRTNELTSLQKTILDISSPHSLPELLNLIVERAANLLGDSGGGLYLTEPQYRRVRCVVSYKTKSDFTGTLLDYGVGAAGYVAETGQPLIIDDYSKWANQADAYKREQPFRAVMSAPMLWQGQVSGVIHILRDDISKKFTKEELNLLLLFANHAAVAVENARLFNLLDQELTERKRAVDLLEQTRKNYETFFNSIDDFLFVLDEQGNIIHTNNTVRDRLGYSEEELFGGSILMVHPPERREEAGRIVGEMLAGTAQFCPVPVMTKLGEQIPVETRVMPGFWDGKPVIFGVTKDISQIKLSEEKFSRAFQSNSALMALSHFETGAYIDVNEVFLETLDFTRDEVIGKTSGELHIFAEVDQRDKIIEKIKQGKTVKDIEIGIRAKDGSRKEGLFSADTIYIGKDMCLLTVMVDITARKQMEESLRESQLLYHSLVESSPLSICRKDLAGRFTFANRHFLELSQITLADLVGKTDFDLHPPELAEKYRRDDQGVLDSKQVQEIIEERAVLGGETVVVQSIKTPIYDGTGKINGIQISFWDITDRKRAEEALRLNEAMFQALFEFSPDAIVATNREGTIMRVNAQAETMFGYRREELNGQPVEMLIPERFVLKHVGHRTGYTANPRPRAMGVGLDFYGRRRDGGELPIEISLGILETSSGTLILSSIRDVTERRNVESELRQSKETLDIAHHALERSFEREQQLARTDSLTGVHNRRFLFELAEREFNIAARYRPPFSMILFDVDYFKQINDTFGHAVGDQALKNISQVVCAEIRSADMIGRYGGDEFVILLPGTSAQEALPLAERIHASVAAMRMDTDKGPLTVTISIGIAQTIHDDASGSGQVQQPDTVENLFLRADQALYTAKQTGRNRTVIFTLE